MLKNSKKLAVHVWLVFASLDARSFSLLDPLVSSGRLF